MTAAHSPGTIEIPRALWLSANDRPHWRTRAKKTKGIRALGQESARAAGLAGRLLGPTLVTVWVSYPTARRADPSNALPVAKALVDGYVDAEVWADDDHEHVVGLNFMRGPKTGRPGIYGIRFDLLPAPEQVHP